MVVTETWLTKEVSNTEFCPPGYLVFRKDRNLSDYPPGTYQREERGGVMILVKGNLNPELVKSADANAEILWLTVNPINREPWLIGACYRPEVAEQVMIEKICESINKAVTSPNTILLGDFNMRHVDWSVPHSPREVDNLFINSILDKELTQIIDQPTRGRNILDLAFVSDTSTVMNFKVEGNFATSDHRMTHIEVQCQVPRVNSKERKVYLFSKADYKAFDEELQEINWEDILKSKGMEDAWKCFKDKYCELREKHVPHKKVKVGAPHKPPWTQYKSVIKAKKRRRKKRINAQNTGLHADTCISDEADIEVANALNKAKADYENKLVENLKEKPKLFFNYTRHFTRSSSSIDYLMEEGKKVTSDKEKADLLNKFFISTQTKSTDFKPENVTKPPNVKHTLRDINFSEQGVRKRLKKVKPDKSSGPDDISAKVLRHCPNIAIALTMLFNKSMQTGVTPQDWRDGNITPLHKKGPRSDKNNYRAVTLTSQVAKLLESLIEDHMRRVFKLNKTISCQQHGFQAKCSCVSQLLECLEDWTLAFDNGHQTDAIYLDMSKAFDVVHHAALIYKLRCAGIRGKVLNWIESFLTNRRQRVVMRNGTSRYEKVLSGVPQGSILGPLLFLIFINDIPNCVISTVKLFADDAKLYRIIKNKEDCHKLQNDLNQLSAWSSMWYMNFNAGKCVVLQIKKNIQYPYTLCGKVLETVSHQKDLGVWVSDDLSPKKHIAEVVKKCNQRIGLIKRCFTDLTPEKIQVLYTTMIRPTIEYASPVWAPYYKCDANKLDSIQSKIEKLSKEPLNFESLESRRNKIDLKETYKFLNDKYKTPGENYFKRSKLRLRGHSHKLLKPHVKTNVRKSFWSVRVIDRWNKLPEEVVCAQSTDAFDKKMRLAL